LGEHRARRLGAQRRHRHRQGVIRVVLVVSPAASSRTRAASLGGTSSTCSPAAASCWASRCPSPVAPSTAQVRSGQSRAHITSCSACAGQALTPILPSGCSPALIPTAVCEPLCGPTPIITAVIGILHLIIESGYPCGGRRAGVKIGADCPPSPVPPWDVSPPISLAPGP